MENINYSANKKYLGKMGPYPVLLRWIILGGGSLVGFLILDRNKYYASLFIYQNCRLIIFITQHK